MRDAETLVNELAKNTYTWGRLRTGKEMFEMVQGGDEIQDTIYLELKSTFERYNPNVAIDNYQNLQTGTTWTVPWAFAYAYTAWTKQELGLNKEIHTKNYRARKYKSVLYQKHQKIGRAHV